jgi:hypothetical protein
MMVLLLLMFLVYEDLGRPCVERIEPARAAKSISSCSADLQVCLFRRPAGRTKVLRYDKL